MHGPGLASDSERGMPEDGSTEKEDWINLEPHYEGRPSNRSSKDRAGEPSSGRLLRDQRSKHPSFHLPWQDRRKPIERLNHTFYLTHGPGKLSKDDSEVQPHLETRNHHFDSVALASDSERIIPKSQRNGDSLAGWNNGSGLKSLSWKRQGESCFTRPDQ